MADVEWKPPTEAEMKVIQARRERSDKISAIMGDYLLKGYKMLASICSNCNTVLLQDKHDKVICVACFEVDAENSKDDPATSDEAARSQVMESEFNRKEMKESVRSSTPNPNTSTRDLSISEPVQVNILSNNLTSKVISESSFHPVLKESKQLLIEKISWASDKLRNSNSPHECLDYCNLIKSCAEALSSINKCT